MKALRLCFWITALLLAATQAWQSRDIVGSDGISYLEMGQDIAHGHWSAANNGYWSPLYPITLAAGLRLAQPTPTQEFAVLHAVNFAIFVFAALSFEFLLGSFAATWFARLTGYTVFLWSSLYLTKLTPGSPDMLMSAFVFLAAGLVLRITAGSGTWMQFATLGTTLGVGYAAKAPMFLLAAVFLGTAILFAPRGPLLPRAVGVLAFAVVAALVAVPLSLQQGRPTFGDSGRINYAWYVSGATYRHWQGEPLGTVRAENAPHWTAGPAATGLPVHATRKILDTPPVFAFDHAFHGRDHTYPVWYDPSYWNEGLTTPFNLAQQLRKLQSNLKSIYALLLNPHFSQLLESGHAYQIASPLWVLCWVGLVLTGARVRLVPAALLVIPAVAAFGMYVMVYSEPRHLAAFVTLLFVGAFSALTIPAPRAKLAAAAVVVIFAATALLTPPPANDSDDAGIAQAFLAAGFAENTKVASLLYSNIDHAQWAHIARARLVAELYIDAYTLDENAFWNADPASQAAVLRAFREAGAEAVVSSRMPTSLLHASPTHAWHQLGATHYYVLRLKESDHV